MTPVRSAVAIARIALVQLLVNAKASFACEAKSLGDLEDSPLLQAALEGDTASVRTLLRSGANPNTRDCCLHITPLHLAALTGHRAIVRALLDANAAVDARTLKYNDPDKTSLHFAALVGHSDIAKILVDAQATVDAWD